MSCPRCGHERIVHIKLNRESDGDRLELWMSGNLLEGFVSVQECPYCLEPLRARLNGAEMRQSIHLEFAGRSAT